LFVVYSNIIAYETTYARHILHIVDTNISGTRTVYNVPLHGIMDM